MTIGSKIYGWVNRSSLGPTLSALPVPVRFHDGQTRLAPFATWRLHRIWRSHPSFEQESGAVYDAYDGRDVIDVGAFEGWYSVLLAPKLDGSAVISCEPDPSAYAVLQTTLAMLGRVFAAPRFVPLPVALGDGSPVSMSHPKGGHPRFAGGADGDTPAPTVDRLVSTFGLEPGLIKIDVEGAEPFVLGGMEETLRANRPIVMLELHPRWLPKDEDPAKVESTLVDLGYTPRRLSSDELATRTLWFP